MIKILYAADNRKSSYHSLHRFLTIYGKYYDIKIAAYTKSSQSLNANWNLDALLDFRGKYNNISFKNSNFALYIREIKRFKPDVIISDMELYSSYAALELGIKLWQVSPLLLYYGAQKSDQNNIYKYYSGLLAKDYERNEYINYILGNSDRKLVLSHLGDMNDALLLKPTFEWVRPNFQFLDTSELIVRMPGSAMYLADAYFSNKVSIVDIDYNDLESIIVSCQNSNCGLSVGENDKPIAFDTAINYNIKFLSQHLETLDI